MTGPSRARGRRAGPARRRRGSRRPPRRAGGRRTTAKGRGRLKDPICGVSSRHRQGGRGRAPRRPA
ncbi:MAG: hypothetical protein EP329_08145 [Deltaproteobacteria bacterium]|nr:MAG: hypothetical protein EP329_08145 [Deltaproteobacteria bacterium]